MIQSDPDIMHSVISVDELVPLLGHEAVRRHGCGPGEVGVFVNIRQSDGQITGADVWISYKLNAAQLAEKVKTEA